jgi:voltage-gated potassium channel
MMHASGEDSAMPFATFRKTVRHLYEGATPEGVRFRYALLAFDIVTVVPPIERRH